MRDFPNYFEKLESRDIFFSYPLDLDFAMLLAFPDKYSVEPTPPSESTIKAVLGKKHAGSDQYDEDEQALFKTYHRNFKLGSKPAHHIEALAHLDDHELLSDMPEALSRLAEAVIKKLEDLPE